MENQGGPIVNKDKLAYNSPRWKRVHGKNGNEGNKGVYVRNSQRKRGALKSNNSSVSKKIRDDMEVDSGVQAKELAVVGSSQPHQAL